MRTLRGDHQYIKEHTIFSMETTKDLYGFLVYTEGRSFTAEEFINEEYDWNEYTVEEVMNLYELQCRKDWLDVCLALHNMGVYFVPVYNEKTILISKY